MRRAKLAVHVVRPHAAIGRDIVEPRDDVGIRRVRRHPEMHRRMSGHLHVGRQARRFIREDVLARGLSRSGRGRRGLRESIEPDRVSPRRAGRLVARQRSVAEIERRPHVRSAAASVAARRQACSGGAL